ncbi:MAG: molybdenum cofactor biosynthesis protein MoaE [bacterium]
MSDKPDYLVKFVEQDQNMSLEALIDFVRRDDTGGIATFTGAVRNINKGNEVSRLEYQIYQNMARKNLLTIINEAQQEWNDRGPLSIAVSHRTGVVNIAEPSVQVAVAAPHRAEALEACRYVIDELKSRVPIWKKEYFKNGETWVENPEQFEEKPVSQ